MMLGEAELPSGTTEPSPPPWLASALTAGSFDVRPLLAEGADPLSPILEKAAALPSGAVMAIDAPFNPVPLRRVLAGRGFSSYGRRLSSQHWRVFFCRDDVGGWEDSVEGATSPEGAFSWIEEDGLHVDVRTLAPPLPMVAILRLIDTEIQRSHLVVHHDRMPRFLLPELAERGWSIARHTESFMDVRLWLKRDP